MKFYWPESTQINERIQFSSDFVRNDGLITTELERTLEGWVTTTRVPKLGDLMHDRGRAEVIIEIKYTINVNVFNSSPNHLPLNPQFSSVAQSCLTFRNPMDHSNTRPPCPSPTPRVYPNPCPSSQWCYPAISSSVLPFSSCPQSFPASRSFPMSQLFASGGQSIGASASTSVFPVNTQDWSPLGWTGWISLQSKGLSGVFSNTTVQKQQFFGTQLSLWSNSHIHTRLLEKQ